MENKISVIVPVYNVEDYLNECVDSLLKQDYSNLEIILVDDGSTDKCGIICDEYAIKDSRIKVKHKQNGGLSYARNAGIDIATGDYITFVDSDDVLSSDFISYLLDLLTEADADMACCQRTEIDENSKHKKGYCNPCCKITVFDNMENALAANEIDTVAWGKLYKKDLFREIRYPVGRLHEDIFTTYKLIDRCKKIVVGPEGKYLYRVRQNSISNINFTHKHMDIVYGKLEYAKFINQKYPNLSGKANADIVYGACVCAVRMAKANYKNMADINFIQKQIRLHEKDFLISGDNRLATKVFSLLAFINLKLTLKLYRCLTH